jgi:hypothetical protein
MTTSGLVPIAFVKAVTSAYEAGTPLAYTPKYEAVEGGRLTGNGPLGSADLL